jgi:hypothetical protein
MTVNLLRLGPLVKAVQELNEQVKRLADAYERKLAEEGLYMQPPKTDTSGPEPEAIYSDEEMDWMREQLELRGKMTPEVRRMFGEPEDVPPEGH